MEQGPHDYTRLTSANNFKTGPGVLRALVLETDGTNAATATVVDATSGSTPVIAELASPGAGPDDRREYAGGIAFSDGLRLAAITGTGAAVVAVYD